MTNTKIRTLIVDDSLTYRKLVRKCFEEFANIEIVGEARNGCEAVKMVDELKPDLVSLDVEMPEMNGLEALKKAKPAHPDTFFVMISSITTAGAKTTIEALNAGAFDFIPKPGANSLEENKRELLKKLNSIILSITSKLSYKLRQTKPTHSSPTSSSKVPIVNTSPKFISRVVAIGISTGGPNALSKMLPEIPGTLPVPVLIVQHMPATFTKSLASSLDAKCQLTVVEAEDGMVIEKGTAYIAPGGRHMYIDKESVFKVVIRLCDDPPENNCRPAADYLFRSVASVYGKGALGVVMTGMGGDGAKGTVVLKKNKAHIVAQDEASCTVYGMPNEAVKLGCVDTQLPLNKIASYITDCCTGDGR